MHIPILLSVVALASARPYIPGERIAVVDLSRLHLRVPRQTLQPPQYNEQYLPIPIQGLQPYQPLPVQQYQQTQNLIPIMPEHQALQQQPQESQDIPGAPTFGETSSSADRPPDFGEYVDFGAHTGDNGAFGWYADYPVNGQTHDTIGFR